MAAPPSQAPTGPEYEEQFLTILNNRSKYESSSDLPPRKHGFVVLVRGGGSLRPLQDLCLDPERQTHNECFTARYRLQPGMAMGTLLASWLSDVTKIAFAIRKDVAGIKDIAGIKDVAGDVRLGPSPDSELTSLITMLTDRPRLKEPTGTLSSEFLKYIIDYIPRTLEVSQRIVLFAELSEEATDPAEWDAAFAAFLRKVPERMGIVISGAPKDFNLPGDDPHFLEITVPKDYGGVEAQGTLAYRYTESSFHSDVPAAKDELDVNDYANAIARFVLHPQTHAPITIGIHGPWGKGKSSFMKLIDSALIKYAEVNRAGNTQKWNDLVSRLIQAESVQAAVARAQLGEEQKEEQQREYERLRDEERALWEEMKTTAKKSVLTVRFNAWQFEDAKQTWAGLASVISEQLEALLPWHSRQWLKIKYAWRHRKSEIILNVLVPLGIFIVFAVLFAFGLSKWATPQDDSVSKLLKLVLPAGSMILAAWYASSQFVKVAQPITERVLSYVAMPNYREQMGFQHRVKDDLQFVYTFLSNRLNTSSFDRAVTFRLVVYIDDLDRCSENKIMEILQAINLILADCEFFVFVGMDTDMIYRAINSSYKKDPNDRFADSYLSKVIQISFFLPDSKTSTRVGYLSTLFSAASRLALASSAATNGNQTAPTAQNTDTAAVEELPYDLSQLLKIVPVQVKEAEDTPDELQAFTDYCDFIDDNPREIKRLINIHRLIKILVQKPNAPLNPDRQKKLAKWLIFCDKWPHLVGNVLDNPNDQPSGHTLLELVRLLDDEKKETSSTSEGPSVEGVTEFAEYVRPMKRGNLSPAERQAEKKRVEEDKNVYRLSAADIDDDFRLAAKLSQMVRKPTHRG